MTRRSTVLLSTPSPDRALVAILCLALLTLGTAALTPAALAQRLAPADRLADRQADNALTDVHDDLAWVIAATVSQEAKLTAGDAAPGDEFGGSVSLAGDRALVGARLDDDAGSASGSAYVFERDAVTGDWTQAAKLTADDAALSDQFGGSVSLSGDRALVGAAADDDGGNNSGSAYVFVRDDAGAWSQEAKLTAADAAPSDLFGWSVSLAGDRALVGARGDGDGDNSGSAYVFVRDAAGAWSQEAKLTAADAAQSDFFGWSVSLSGDRALVGAIGGDSDGDNDSGSAYVFVRDDAGAWSQEAKLTAGDAAPSDEFGVSVSLAGDRALVGARFDDDGDNNSGSAYVFVRDDAGAWSQEAKLTAGDAAFGDFFGGSVSLAGERALVGAIGDDDGGSFSGSAYVFERDATTGQWTQAQKLTAGDAAQNDEFGVSVSLAGDRALVGTVFGDSDGGDNSGSAYVFGEVGQPVSAESETLLTAFGLSAAYPNPLSQRGKLSVELLEAADVRVVVYDVLGRTVATLADAPMEAGHHVVSLDVTGLAPGSYVVRMTAGSFAATQRLTVVR